MDTRPLTILLVEDDGRHAPLVREAVGRGGSRGADRVLEARDISAGMAMASREEIDVLLLDLPGGAREGVAALRSVRARLPELPVVVITDGDDDAIASLALGAGAQDHVPRDELGHSLLGRSLRYAVERHRLQLTMRELSLTDELTGLYNMRGFVTFAEHHLRLALRTRGLLVGTLVVEDAIGTRESEGALAFERAVSRGADLLRAVFRASDVLARIGDGEFIVLVVDAGPEAVEIVEHRMTKLARGMLGASEASGAHFSSALQTVESLENVEGLLAQVERMRSERHPLGA